MSRSSQVAVGLFLLALVVFRATPRGQLYDSRHTLLVAHQLITTADPALDRYVEALGGLGADGRPRDYRLVVEAGHVHWLYPLGTPILVAPVVGLADLLGVGPVGADGLPDRRAERRLQRWLAAVAMAAAGVLFFGIARQWLDVRRSALVAVAGLFASPVFSTTSRSLWSQTGALLLVSAAAWLIARGRARGESIRPVAVATCLALAWLCRPTAAVPAVGVAVFVAYTERRALVPLLTTGALFGAGFVALFLLIYGQPLPPYTRPATHTFAFIPEALAGNWISPARGLIVYCPVVLVVFAWLATGWRRLPDRALATLAIGVVVAHWLLVSSHAPWWGGYGYGARLMADSTPWWVVVAVLGDATRPVGVSPRQNVASWAAAALLAVSIAMNGIGAISRSAAKWNERQAEPDFDAQLWRLSDAPFVVPFTRDASADARMDGGT